MPIEFVILDEAGEPVAWVPTEMEAASYLKKSELKGITCKKIIKSDAGHISVEGKEYEVALSREEPYDIGDD